MPRGMHWLIGLAFSYGNQQLTDRHGDKVTLANCHNMRRIRHDLIDYRLVLIELFIYLLLTLRKLVLLNLSSQVLG